MNLSDISLIYCVGSWPCQECGDHFSALACPVRELDSVSSLADALGKSRPDIVLTRSDLSEGTCRDVLYLMRKLYPEVPVVLLSGPWSPEAGYGFDATIDPYRSDLLDGLLEIAFRDRPSASSGALSDTEVNLSHDSSRFNPHPTLELSVEGAVLFVNEAARRLSDSMGMPVEALLPADHRMTTRICVDADRSVSNQLASCKGKLLNWTYIPVAIRRSVWAFGIDLSDLVPSETTIRQAEIKDSVRRMAAGISHDFNNILTVIKGYSDLIASDPGLSDRVREYVEMVVTATDRAAQLVSRLMAFSRQQVLVRSDCNLNAIVELVLERHKELPIDHIVIAVDLGADLPLFFGDAELIADALDCIVINAVEAIPTGGVITVQTTQGLATKRGEDQTRGHFLKVSIADDGKGIEAGVLERIFDPVFTTRRTGRGTGLGLAAANGIVHQHGGWIEVESEHGRGAVFTVCLPAEGNE
jgi:signal transduction histidine kinase